MNTEFLKSFVKDSWYLFVVLAVALAAAIYGSVVQGSTPAPPAPDSVSSADQLPPGLSREEAMRVLNTRPERPFLTKRERVEKVIGEHLEKVEEEPESEDTPAYLNAAGNLAMNKLGEYEQAAEYFETLLRKYPHWEFIRGVYPSLAMCYNRLEDKQHENDVWRRMMNRYPEGTNEYLVAKWKLGLD